MGLNERCKDMKIRTLHRGHTIDELEALLAVRAVSCGCNKINDSNKGGGTTGYSDFRVLNFGCWEGFCFYAQLGV